MLFRGAAEGTIRKHFIQEFNALDAVIGLPPNLFYGTSIPASILVFKRCREHSEDVLFIDASREFEKQGNQNVLSDLHVAKIVETYAKREAIEKYSYRASLEEIAENDYNLNIPRYVDTFEEEEPVDLHQVSTDLKKLENDMRETDASIAAFCAETGYSPTLRTRRQRLMVQEENPVIARGTKQSPQQETEAKQIATPAARNDSKAPALRFPEFSGEWEEKRLGEISGSPTYGMNAPAISFDGQNKYLRITDIDEHTNTLNYDGLTSPGGNLIEEYLVESGDLLFTRTGASTGKSYLYDEKDGAVYFAGFLIKFPICKANPKFISNLTKRNHFKNGYL